MIRRRQPAEAKIPFEDSGSCGSLTSSLFFGLEKTKVHAKPVAVKNGGVWVGYCGDLRCTAPILRNAEGLSEH